MRYDKKIKYLDYLENGARIRGSGFLKTELFEDCFKLELTVKGGRAAGDAAGDVVLCGNGREEPIGNILLSGGEGEFRHICHIDVEKGGTIGETGITCDELRGVRILLGEGREIACIWAGQRTDTSAELPAEQREAREEKESSDSAPLRASQLSRSSQDVRTPRAAQSSRRQEKVLGREVTGKEAPGREVTGKEAPGREVTGKEAAGREALGRDVSGKEALGREAPGRKTGPEAVPLMENKWLQLCAIYPHIKPFQDQREYLSIGPEDFVLFSAESYKAACNSFMLHGYYNYRHLILAREERRGEIVYYAGVPGNYYDREKQVAIMFGFESFECAEEPAQSSDFGYYMMRVQL